jgi:hypothetical protein
LVQATNNVFVHCEILKDRDDILDAIVLSHLLDVQNLDATIIFYIALKFPVFENDLSKSFIIIGGGGGGVRK